MFVQVQVKLWSFLLHNLRIKHEIVNNTTGAANLNLVFPPVARREYQLDKIFTLSLEFRFLKGGTLTLWYLWTTALLPLILSVCVSSYLCTFVSLNDCVYLRVCLMWNRLPSTCLLVDNGQEDDSSWKPVPADHNSLLPVMFLDLRPVTLCTLSHLWT